MKAINQVLSIKYQKETIANIWQQLSACLQPISYKLFPHQMRFPVVDWRPHSIPDALLRDMNGFFGMTYEEMNLPEKISWS